MTTFVQWIDQFLPQPLLAAPDLRYRGRAFVLAGWIAGILGGLTLISIVLVSDGSSNISILLLAFLILVLASPYILRLRAGMTMAPVALLGGYIGFIGTLMIAANQLTIQLAPAIYLAPILGAYFVGIRTGVTMLIGLSLALVGLELHGAPILDGLAGLSSTTYDVIAPLLFTGGMILLCTLAMSFIAFSRRALVRGQELDEHSRQHQAQLAHIARLSTVGEMASGMAHELNQPLTAIAGYIDGSAQRLRTSRQVTDEVLGALKKASDQAMRAGEIIRRIRTFVRQTDDVREATDINSAIHDILGLLQYEVRRSNVSIEARLDPNLPKAQADGIQIQQVVLNLARNSLDAIRGGETERGEIAIRTEPYEDGFVRVHVEDNGPGMTNEQRDRMFEPFYTTKERGLGMGLTICQSIVEEHGGRIWARPEDHGGATFSFTLPTNNGDTHGVE